MFSKTEILEIRNKLPKGSIKQIVNSTKVNRTTVSQTLNGNAEVPNLAVLDAAIAIIDEREREIIRLKRKLNGSK